MSNTPGKEGDLGQSVPILYSAQRQEYSSYADESFSWRFIEKPALDKYVLPSLSQTTKMLDAGCGTGRTIRYLLEKGCLSGNVVGVDINKDMLDVSKQNLNRKVRLIQADLVKLPLPNNSLDFIICDHVLHYFDERKFTAVMDSFHQALKKGGLLFYIITHPVRTARKSLDKYFERRWIMDHTPWGTDSPLYFRPISDLVNQTIQAKFTIMSLNEPEVAIEGKQTDSNDYEKYASCPSRIAILAKAVK